MNNSIGKMFYKYDKDDLTLLRLKKVIGTKAILKDTKTDSDITLDTDDLIKDYYSIKPDGVIKFDLINPGEFGNINDVAIVLDTFGENPIKVICRQNINDCIYGEVDSDLMGMCVASNSGVSLADFAWLLAYETPVKSYSVNIYIDDTLDQMLDIVDLTEYDSLLNNLKKVYGETHIGMTSSVKELLISTCFMDDFRSIFNINHFNYKLSETDELDSKLKKYIEKNILRFSTEQCSVVKYNKDIDLSKIQRDYILLSDSDDILFILLYTKLKHSVQTNNINKYIADQLLELSVNNKTL